MKKKQLLVLGLIALMLAGGLALAGCHLGCEGRGTCELKNDKGSVCTNDRCAVWNAAAKDKDGKCDC